ncbi:VOC family protein [Rhodococcus sp. T2V]|uniref:VOC family protein n=1 Tax=Rhodococcus sp. T2V TaxID=3034164 RepID=UPI0023E27F0B|nr:VOC family protein [Rhodococcus sp. T2V]MDF3313159.1 VOC family protein [Rhodococcus sp. T2V]
MSTLFGGARQVGYVVRDIEKAMAHWSGKMKVGPWFYKENVGVTEFSYYGEALEELPKLSIAIANSGSMQIELIQQRNDAPSLYRDFLNESGEGAQHIAYWTTEFDRHAKEFLEAGYVEGHAGRMGTRGRFAYYVHPDVPGGTIELSETTGGKAEYFKTIEEASIGWDGTDPIRRLGVTK